MLQAGEGRRMFYKEIKYFSLLIKRWGLRVIVWVILYLFKHAGKDFQPQILFVS